MFRGLEGRWHKCFLLGRDDFKVDDIEIEFRYSEASFNIVKTHTKKRNSVSALPK